MDIRVLKYFLAVAQEGSILKASKLLHTSQPNLSRQLADLETTLGKKLFERGNRTIKLTEEGMFLRKRAQEIISLAERTEMELQLFGEGTAGDVHIGAAESYTMKSIADIMLKQRKISNKIKYHIFSGSTIEVTEQLNKGLLDFAILVEPDDLSQYDYLRLPTNDTWGVLMKKDSPLANNLSIQPKDIKNEPLLVAQQQLDSRILSGWLGEDIESLNVVGTFNLILTPSMMVESGLGYLFTFDKLLNTSGESELCFRPLNPKLETSLYLVWKKYQIFSQPAKMFLEEVQENLF